MQQRQVLARVDTEERRGKVAAARLLIYQQHYVVDTPQAEALLKPESLVPTKVLIFLQLWCYSYLFPFWCLECIFRKVKSIGL